MTLLKEFSLHLLSLWRQQIHFFSITSAEETQHLQLEPWAPAWKGSRFWETNFGYVTYYYSARGIWLFRTWYSSWTISRDPLCRLCDSLQQGHLLPWHQCQIDLPAWHKARCARSYLWRSVAGCSFTCLISSNRSQSSEVLYCIVAKYQQYWRQEKRHRHPDPSCPSWSQVISMARRGGCRSRDNLSTIDEAFTDSILPTPLGLPPLWGPGSIPNNWADVCGFLNPPGSQHFWKVPKHGAFSIRRKSLGLRPTDQSCHHEAWLHLHFVDWNNKWNHIKRTTTGTSALRRDLRVLDMELRNVTSAKLWATTRYRHECATTCAPWFLRFHFLINTKCPDELRCLGQTSTGEANFGSIHSCASHLSCSTTITTCIIYAFFQGSTWFFEGRDQWIWPFGCPQEVFLCPLSCLTLHGERYILCDSSHSTRLTCSYLCISSKKNNIAGSIYKKHLSMSTMTFLLVCSTWPMTEDARFSQTSTLSTPISTSSPSTFMTQDGILADQVMEGEQGWVMQGILSRASFRRPPLSGQETFTV